MINIALKGGTVKQFDGEISAADVAKSIGAGLAKSACACKINGVVCDLRTIITSDCDLDILTFEDEDGKKAYRHTASHIMAQAVKRLYPSAKLAIGPATETGFYYDFDITPALTMADLEKIEAEIKKIIKENLPLEKVVCSAEDAKTAMKDEPYKHELIDEHAGKGDDISLYRQGGFTDLCAGPHLMNTGSVKAVKLTACTGAYWRGDAEKQMLCRVYGTAFPKTADLEAYLLAVEEAKKRDHNKLGREMEYFTTVDYIGQGFPILMPKGAKVIQLLQRFVEDEEEKRGYLLTKTPLLAKNDLYRISGHWDHYRDGMFVLGDEEKDKEIFALRPMTCPFQFQVYLARMRSFRDLPMRFNETSTLFRNEASGEMHGLIRVRQFTISEGHLACRPDQVEEEFKGCIDLAQYMLKTVGLEDDISYRFSKWDENNKDKYIGSKEDWESAQDTMRKILDNIGLRYTEADGEAAFYGPKLDLQIKNVHGKEDTLITIQIDFELAQKFGMEYVDTDGIKKHPVVIHRTSIGCYERTLALLIEKFAGAMPTWLAPLQVKILPIGDRQEEYAVGINNMLRSLGIRAEIDNRSEKIGYKIREGQIEKVPYMLIVGDKEVEEKTVAIRARGKGDVGSLTLDKFISIIVSEIDSKSLESMI